MERELLEVSFRYFKEMFDEEELEQHKNSLNNVGIKLIERNVSGQPMMFMDQFTNQISLILSNPLFLAYAVGFMTDTSYEVLKKSIMWIWNCTIGKRLIKLHMSGEQEEKEATFGIQIRIDSWTKIDFRLSGDVSDELKSKSIDKAFEMMNTVPRGIEHRPIDWFANYSWEDNEWNTVNVAEEIRGRLINQEDHTGVPDRG